jgi:serine/threonine-protein kinase HipA
MRRLEVWLDFGCNAAGEALAARRVGTLAEDGVMLAFEYDAGYLSSPLPISPQQLPPRLGVFTHADQDFDRLPGVLADALPDGFGRLVQDRAFEAQGVSRARVSPMDRLAALGDAAMGALTFRPAAPLGDGSSDGAGWPLDLAALAAQGERLLEGSAEAVLPQLAAAGGSPGGARPKVLAGVSGDGRVMAGVSPAMAAGREPALPDAFTPYLIKFAARDDIAAYGRDVGAMELAYWELARRAGIDVPPATLFPAADGQRWFGVQRFDRHGPGGRGRLHLHTLGGLLHASHRLPSLDYAAFLAVTGALTRDLRQVEQAVRRMAFNVFAHNRDDHARNFAYLMDAGGTWRLAPAYDLTFSAGMGGQHTTAIGGETMAPTVRAMYRAARDAGLDGGQAMRAIAHVEEAVAQWPAVADALAIRPAITQRVRAVLDATRAAAHRASGGAPRGAPPRRAR